MSSLSFPIFSQTHIDYQIRSDDLYARVSNEFGNENLLWRFKAKMSSSSSTGTYSSIRTIAHTEEYSSGRTLLQSTVTLQTGTCLDNVDNVYVFIEGWEEDGILDQTYVPSWDDDYQSDTDSHVDINNDILTRNSWVAFNSNDNSTSRIANAGSIGATGGDYRVEIDTWWDWTIPVVSCNLSNVSYGSLDINMTNGNYRVTSWTYEVSDDAGFSNIVSNGSTSNSSTTATGLAPLTQYYVRITGTNERGSGNFSGTQTTTTPDAVTEPSGNGSEGNPYQIADITNLNWLVQTSSAWDKYFIQTADIDASGTSEWNSNYGISQIGNSTTPFTGEYDGNDKSINYPSNSNTSAEGLFEETSGAIIKNLSVQFANYTGSSNTGILVGRAENETQILNCYTTGTVDGHQSVGGLVGALVSNSSVANSYSSATVTGYSSCGGLVGLTFVASVSNSYATGNVTADGTQYAGGLIGYFHNNSTMINCYSTGEPSIVSGQIGGLVGQKGNPVLASNSFWDMETSGQAESDVGIGKTTSELKSQFTFTNVNWDFTTPIWSIDGATNNGYPNLENNLLTYLWVGNTDSDWNTASNWNLGTLPSSSDAVYISQSQNNTLVSSSADCSNLTIYSGAALTIAAGASIIPTGTITNNGTFNMQHSMSDGEWHFVSSPVEGATANIFYGDYLQYYDETLAENNYVDIEDENMALSACRGFSWRNFNKGGFTFTGDPHHGNQSIATTANNAWGWNLVGNPYPSSLDWDMLDDTYGTVYLWTGTATEFATYNDGATTNGGTRYIAPMQGFLISTSAPGTFSVSNSHRTHDGANGYVKSENLLSQYLKLKIEDGTVSDEVFIQFGESHLEGYDMKDGFKIPTGNPDHINIYTKSTDGNLSIDRRPECESIQLGIKSEQAKTLKISKVESSDLINIQLEDTKLKTFHNLSQGAYQFDWNISDIEERFILHLKATNTNDMEAHETQIYAANGQVYVRMNEKDKFKEITIYDLAGRIVHKDILAKQDLQSFDIQSLRGTYLVQLIGKENSKVKKIVL